MTGHCLHSSVEGGVYFSSTVLNPRAAFWYIATICVTTVLCILHAFAISGTIFNVGCIIGWSVQASLIDDDPTTTITITLQQQEWLIACTGISSIVSSIVAGWLIETLGPKLLIHVSVVPTAIIWIVMGAVDSYTWLIIGRIVHGFYIPLVILAAQPYLAEISEPEIRGRISCFPEFFISLGLFFMDVLAYGLSWQNGTLFAGVLLVPSLISLFFIYESPYWLLRVNRRKEALRSLTNLRSPGTDVDNEYTLMRTAVLDLPDSKGTVWDQMKRMKQPSNYRPAVIVGVLFLARELSGAVIIFTYAPFFFSSAGVPNPITATVMVGFVRLVFTFVGGFFIDRLGRRLLIVSSLGLCAIMMAIIYATIGVASLEWIPLIATLVFIASFGLGAGPVPWVLLGEMLPTPVRSVSSSFVFIFLSLMYFLEGIYFPELVIYFGFDSMVLFFALCNVLGAVFASVFLPETKNKTLVELQCEFDRPTILQGQRRTQYTQLSG